ncbi:MAG: S1 RNA-binding domain-containing protein [Candidatus Aenigmarchaeota archaeon]|nr:S1 RNA-binding domain-containing protein [Candidatus Aenigmarchaeota archaeon]
MPKKKGFPSEGELVICKIVRINPNSAFAQLAEYDKEGMIHISEIVSGWIRDIRNHVKQDQLMVAKVLRTDEKKGHISLSLKRLTEQQKKEKMKEYKLDLRAEKMFELVAAELKQNKEKAYEEVGYYLVDKFGSLYDAFRVAMEKPGILEERGIPKKWAVAITEIAKKNIETKEFRYFADISVKTYKPDGIKVIKEMMDKLNSMGLEVSYISAPKYRIRYTTKSKKASREFEEKKEKVLSIAKDIGVEAVIKDA